MSALPPKATSNATYGIYGSKADVDWIAPVAALSITALPAASASKAFSVGAALSCAGYVPQSKLPNYVQSSDFLSRRCFGGFDYLKVSVRHLFAAADGR